MPPEELQWCIGPVDEPNITSHVYTLPDGVRAAPEGRALSEMLIAGELDAIYSPPRPRRYHPVDGPIVRLFPDIRAIEREYSPRHARVPAAASDRAAAGRVAAEPMDRTRADRGVSRCTETFAKAQRSFPYARLGWIRSWRDRGADGRRLPC